MLKLFSKLNDEQIWLFECLIISLLQIEMGYCNLILYLEFQFNISAVKTANNCQLAQKPWKTRTKFWANS